jgi:dihydroorotate dehydrogenase (fumarate)
MADLSTRFMGLDLRNPVIAGSSGLSASAKAVKELEEAGAGAVVLKSIFEEEIVYEMDDVLKEAASKGLNMDQFDYYDYEIKGAKIDKYTDLIREAKRTVSIPVIASINCTYSHEWTYYAKNIAEAGADALELNMFFLPTDLTRSAEEMERTYFEIVRKVQKEVSIPVALKISHYFTSLGSVIRRLSGTGIKGLVLFNRFYSPDFDIEKLTVVPKNVFSTAGELHLSLRWIALMSQKVDCDLAASTGVHDGQALIKQLLAGAKAVQVVSALYRNGKKHIGTMLQDLQAWMNRKGYGKIEDFRGKMSQEKSANPAVYERVQFMKYFGGDREPK